MAKRYRVGIIGRTGKGNYGHGLDTVWKEIDRVEVAAVADDDPAGLEQGKTKTGAPAAYADYREMLDRERLDIVAVAPRWLDRHRELVLAAADHGCHIYMEKPFCRDLEEADEMVQACEMRHLKLAIAHQTRWSPVLDVVKKEIQKGTIGKVLEIRCRGKEDARGGAEDLWVLGSHVLDLMRAFGGDPTHCLASVFEKGQPVTKKDVREGNEGIGPLAGDTVRATYPLAAGATGFFASTRGAGGNPSRFGVQIFGAGGVIEFLSGPFSPCHLLQDPSWSPGRSGKSWVLVTSNGVGQPETIKGSSLHLGNVMAVNDLIDCIEHPEKQPRCSLYDARWTVEMIAGVFESHRIGGPVALPLKNRKNPLGML
jgi:predicted dehydrogenase